MSDERAFHTWLVAFWADEPLFAMPSSQRERERERYMLRAAFLAGLKLGRDEVYADEAVKLQQEQEAR